MSNAAHGSLLSRLETRLEKFESRPWLLLVFFATLYFAGFCLVAVRGVISNDELFTIYIARLPGLHDVWKALATGAEQTPPLIYLITRADFALLGTDIGDYGKDRGTNLIDLLEEMVLHKEDFKLRLRNVSPRWLIASTPRFAEVLKTGKIGYLLSPVESLSDHVLENMARGYRARDYMAAAYEVRRAAPKIYFTTQIMVGFPGETEGDFRKSAEVFKSRLFDYVEIYRFTPRARTKAAKMDDQVPHSIASRRYRQLLLRSLFLESVRRKTRRILGMHTCPPISH